MKNRQHCIVVVPLYNLLYNFQIEIHIKNPPNIRPLSLLSSSSLSLSICVTLSACGTTAKQGHCCLWWHSIDTATSLFREQSTTTSCSIITIIIVLSSVSRRAKPIVVVHYLHDFFLLIFCCCPCDAYLFFFRLV